MCVASENFFSRMLVLSKNKKKDNFESKSVEGAMIGYPEESKGY